MRVSELQFARLVTEDGETLGHVIDVRSHGPPESGEPHGKRRIDEIVYGRRGLLERFGVRRARGKSVPWSAVVEIGKDEIVVRRPR